MASWKLVLPRTDRIALSTLQPLFLIFILILLFTIPATAGKGVPEGTRPWQIKGAFLNE